MNRRRFFLQTGALSAPGMDLPGRTDPYDVLLVGADGQSMVFAT